MSADKKVKLGPHMLLDECAQAAGKCCVKSACLLLLLVSELPRRCLLMLPLSQLPLSSINCIN